MMKPHHLLTSIVTLLLCCGTTTAMAQQRDIDIDYEASLTFNTGSEQLAPYYIASNCGGTVTQQHSALLRAALWHTMDTTVRLSWGAGVELWSGYASSADYERYNMTTGTFEANSQHPARAWVQQAYVEGKYRSVMVMLGGKRFTSHLVNDELSSGDLIMSGNARPPVGVRAGFVNFQNIPFTRGWLQIAGEVGYYTLSDSKWLENHYNYYNHFINTDYLFHYKNFYLRTRPDQPVVFTIGAQASSQFGGTATYYNNGNAERAIKLDKDLKAFWRTMIAGSGGGGGDNFVEGNHLGSWDIALDYNFKHGGHIRGYYQSPWEDGSGIGMLNGFDGLWGVEYASADPDAWVTGAVIEYMDLTNHSGPIHWAPADHENTPITDEATGNDDYYNNYIYNGYQSHGMSIGSPFVRSTLYNTDGYMRYRDNVMRGVHVGISGCITPQLRYRLLASYRKAWGTTSIPRAASVSDTSMMLEGTYRPARQPALAFKAQLAFDSGSLYGDNVGGLISITYHGNFSISR